ncbi:MAG TPA: methyltransferase domain-containing protein [Gemmatimonadales bacterium]|nr:methyltransferase domain-containing protein [Gemmatimonadales bacterium]
MSATTERKRYPAGHWSQWPVSEESVDAHLRLATDVYQRTKFDVFGRLVGRDLRGQRVLDYGGGAGILAVRCAELGAQVTLLDPEPNSLGIARLLARRRGVSERLETVRAESVTSSVAGRRYDLVVLMDVIEHLPDDGAVLRAVARCQDPGDRLFISTQNSLSLNYLLEGTYHRKWLREEHWCGWDPTHVRFYRPGSLRRRLAQAGYRPTRWWGTFIVPYNILSWLVLLRRKIERSSLHRLDLALGGLFPFNRLGWSLMVLAERARA